VAGKNVGMGLVKNAFVKVIFIRWKRKLKGVWYEFILLFRYYSFGFSRRNKQCVIMMFEGTIPHGGFVDRLKGIVSFYELSKRNNWEFKIYHASPFKLSLYLKENIVYWEEHAVVRRFPSSRTIHFFDQPLLQLNHLVSRFKSYCTYHVYSNVDFLSRLYPDHSSEQLDKLWGNSFNELFQVSEELEKALQAFLQDNKKHIGIH
jgi:hypothetical protein